MIAFIQILLMLASYTATVTLSKKLTTVQYYLLNDVQIASIFPINVLFSFYDPIQNTMMH